MACRTPLISNHDSPISHYLIDGENGLLVDFNNENEIAQAVVRLINDKALRKRLGGAARRIIEENFNLNNAMKEYERLFVQLQLDHDNDHS